MPKIVRITAAYLLCVGLFAACSTKEAPQPNGAPQPSEPPQPNAASVRQIVAITPISADEALVITTPRFDPLNPALELVHITGARRWQSDLADFPVITWQSPGAPVANATHIFVLGRNQRDALQVLALARENGKEAWRFTLPDERQLDTDKVSLIADGERLVVIYELPEDTTKTLDTFLETANAILGLKASNGERVWPEGSSSAIAARSAIELTPAGPGRLVVTGRGFMEDETTEPATFELDTATGKVLRRLPSILNSCLTPIGVLGDDPDVVLIPRTPSGLGEPRILVPQTPGRRVASDVSMAIHKDLAILTFEHSPHFEIDIEVRGIDLKTGEARWTNTIAKPPHFYDFIAVDGVFPKMLPVFEDNDRDQYAVSILNLETGERLPLEERQGMAVKVFATKDRTIVLFPFEHVLISYDGETGKPSQPLPGMGSSSPHLSAHTLRFGRLWYYDTDAKPSADPTWTVIDIPTWEVLHHHGK